MSWDRDRTPVHVSVVPLSRQGVVQILLEAGANTALQDASGSTAMLEACIEGRDAVIEVLLAHGNR